MKITIEVDCTPEEARRAMGLPDVTALQQTYLARLSDMADGNFRPETLEALVRGWAPMSEAGFGLWRALTEAATKPGEAPR